jgi:hypothetical protein
MKNIENFYANKIFNTLIDNLIVTNLDLHYVYGEWIVNCEMRYGHGDDLIFRNYNIYVEADKIKIRVFSRDNILSVWDKVVDETEIPISDYDVEIGTKVLQYILKNLYF